MPFPKKFTTAQIMRLYEEFQAQDKDLKTFLKEKGLEDHYMAIHHRFDRLEKRKVKGLPLLTPTSSPKDTVAATVQEAIEARQREQTEQTLILGEAVRSAYFQWAAKKGMNIENIKKTPIHKAVLKALEKEAKYDELVKENLKLKEALRLYAQEVDPLFRLKSAIKLINEFLQTATVAEAYGIDIKNSGIIEYYQNLLESYLKAEAG